MEARTPSSQATWDAFFSDFYLRAYAADGVAYATKDITVTVTKNGTQH